MNSIISVSNAFAKWLKLDLPRIPSPDGKKIGTQTLITNSDSIAWQCHVTRKHPHSAHATVIAVEAYSRFAIIIPYSYKPDQAKFESDLSRQWANQMAHLMINSGALTDNDIPTVFNQFRKTKVNFNWVKNTDLSVNGHVSDTEQWILQTFDKHNIDHLDEENAFGLGLHINEMFKRAKSPDGKKVKFYPVARFLDDSLYRFANKLSHDKYPHTIKGNFPNPYKTMGVDPDKIPMKNNEFEAINNVISLSDFKKLKEQ